MGDEIPNAMNLDLNLGPSPSSDTEPGRGSPPIEPLNFEYSREAPHFNLIREVRLSARPSRRIRQRWRSLFRANPIPPEARNIALEFVINSSNAGGGILQAGEGSVSTEERNSEVIKSCEDNAVPAEDGASGKKEDEEKANSDDGSFFDCNICLDLAKDPVVTCCGHLFCWACLYQWLHVHSDANECPVCKGEVTTKSVTPIYGRGKSTHEPSEDYNLKIPSRPDARRMDSWRQTIPRNPFSIPIEEMIRRLGNRFDMTRDLLQVQTENIDAPHDSPERNSSLLNRILIAGELRREQNTIVPSDGVVDSELTQSVPINSEIGHSHRHRRLSLLLRSSHAHRAATTSNFTSEISSAERLAESYVHQHHVERNREQPQAVDDRDSVSSIAAVIHSESQTVDTAVEIDSTVSLSTSSSRRRNDSSRVSDVDSGDSRANRRRRLN
ncbi:Ubiquitin--protein ligase [Bertholletia excelsa]